MFPNQLLGDRLTSGVAEAGVVRRGKSRRIRLPYLSYQLEAEFMVMREGRPGPFLLALTVNVLSFYHRDAL